MNIYKESNMGTLNWETEKWYKELQQKQNLPMKYDNIANSNNGEMTFILCFAWAMWEFLMWILLILYNIYEIGPIILQ